MCGVAGILNLSARSPIDSDLLQRMGAAMVHRGPDGEGVWVSDDRDVGLAHRRLAILDLSARAGQPMRDGGLVISYNGEIYNHAVLRRELTDLQVGAWQTDHSDTEVVLKAYRAWGIDCIHRLRGMFAFSLWDADERVLWLVRDRLGVKPLYYAEHAGRLLFASEIKALLQDPGLPREVDEEALFHYLSFLTTPAPMTLFAGIRKLPAASWMRVGPRGDIRVERYWDALGQRADLSQCHPRDYPGLVLDTLRESVALRKAGDVPVGVFLSGGIDSSTNAFLFSANETQPVRTFSIGFDTAYRSYPSELPFARRVAAQVGAEHHDRELGIDELLAFLPGMVWHQDEPIADPVCVPLYYLSQLAREHGVKVCQVGEGADELFLGYPPWLTKHRLQRLAALPFTGAVQRLLAGVLWHSGHRHGNPYEWLRRTRLGQPLFWGGAEAFTQQGKCAVLSPQLRRRFSGMTSWDALAPLRQRFLEQAGPDQHLLWMSYLDLNLRLPELLLMRVDKMSMAAGVEARVPFLDHRFVEMAMGIPPAAKIADGRAKALLRRSVRGLLPDTVLDRPKQGFDVPVHEILVDRLGAFAQRELEAFCRDTGYLDRARVATLFRSRNRRNIWPLLNLAMWWRRFVAEQAPLVR